MVRGLAKGLCYSGVRTVFDGLSTSVSYMSRMLSSFLPLPFFFFFNDTATTEIYTLSLHDALPISPAITTSRAMRMRQAQLRPPLPRSEEHTSELQSHDNLVCRLLLEKKKKES